MRLAVVVLAIAESLVPRANLAISWTAAMAPVVETARAIERRLAANEAEAGATFANEVVGVIFGTKRYRAPWAQLVVRTTDLLRYVGPHDRVAALNQLLHLLVSCDILDGQCLPEVDDVEDLRAPARRPRHVVQYRILEHPLDAKVADRLTIFSLP